ncbi:MAG: ABC transporter permease [Bifidobacteriaceae bacterium]|jgi:ribose transport system permease protein|nr:ABC transporter permease [Bifidobacteriaceae bacterium]
MTDLTSSETWDRPSKSIGRVVLDVSRRYATVGLIIVLGVVFTFASPFFLTPSNLSDMLLSQGVKAGVALAVLFPLIIGEFDLSVGYLVGFLAVLGAKIAHSGWPAWAIVLVMLALSVLIGWINGLLVVTLRISAFIATLATGIVLGAMSNGISGGQIIFGDVPKILIDIGRGRFLGMGISIWIILLIAAILVYVLEHMPVGRKFYAIGGNETVAFFAGVPTPRYRIMAFIMAGLLVGIASVFQLGLRAGGDPTFGPGLLLPAYAAVFLGMTAHRPGQYNVIGTIIAIVLLAVGFNGLSLIGVPFWAEPLFDGLILLVAVLVANKEAREVKVGA